MLVATKDVSQSTIISQWATEAIRHANLTQDDQIREVLGDLSALNFSRPEDVIKHLIQKAKSYDQPGQFNITPLIELSRRIIRECEFRDDAQDINSPFITAYKYNSVTKDMDRVRIPVSQVLYFIEKPLKIPGRSYFGGEANVILNDQNRTELSLIDCSENNTAEFLLNCYIKSAEEVVTAWKGK
ncbi:hypothetical protein [Pantoea agglomerans]|uniref:hypothetical protein n=1 Tax=Enterobacter agglomerans TaxID=549 RepID=UPI000E21436B|nr:hypothetical protein [Pantoea agglomerans]MCH9408186.1 hypothetical protein [Pantoea agglomerans]NKE96785.1 hypothetical protein [Pantoea agglomerans]QTC52500.1 hypothetical protein H0Z11_20905 [Pantoea agglomerans]TRO71642.1 hypothetical protein E5140_18045 [Pantoea agglomerans]WNK33328.1 hypothetical protein RM157_23570 [Pantoea agglomerans]